MKALDKIKDRAAGRRNARLTDRIAQAAERYPEPGDRRDWYQVTLNADRELTEARKDAAFWREQMLRDAPGSEAREQHCWDMKEAEDTTAQYRSRSRHRARCRSGLRRQGRRCAAGCHRGGGAVP